MTKSIQKPIIGIGDYRVFDRRVFGTIANVLKGVRSVVAEGVSTEPIYDWRKVKDHNETHENKLGLWTPEAYYDKKVVDTKQEIVDAISDELDNMKSPYTITENAQTLYDVFGGKENTIGICYSFFELEQALINDIAPTSAAVISCENHMLQVERERHIQEKCDGYKTDKERRATIDRVVKSKDIDAIVELLGEDVFQKRIESGDRYNSSSYSWNDIKQSYGLSEGQIQKFRRHKKYHAIIKDACIGRFNKWRENGRQNYPDQPLTNPTGWLNRTIIERAGGIGFVEPDYDWQNQKY